MALQRRLLQDIAELQSNPYPNITLIPNENDIRNACLILNPSGEKALHLSVNFDSQYPLHPPVVTIQSHVVHPNVFDTYICASILNTTEGYTPAYTLKGIAIQLLSFFSSDQLEQSYGGAAINLKDYKSYSWKYRSSIAAHNCRHCHFIAKLPNSSAAAPKEPKGFPLEPFNSKMEKTAGTTRRKAPTSLASLPDELLVAICDQLKTEELFVFAGAWNRIGGEHGVLTRFSLIHNRELICFCLKQSFKTAKLGVGVHIEQRGRQGTLESEFDFLSHQAFTEFSIERSVQGLRFEYWMPLPLTRRHYTSIRDQIRPSLNELAKGANLAASTPVDVIYHFMSDIVVKLSSQASQNGDRSSLKHASEKAIESYYHMFHLLLCVATEDDSVVRSVNRTLQGVLNGRSSKNEIPKLGQLLVAVLISDADMTQDLLMAIIKETITRNVVWMLDPKGKGMAELSYMEADGISPYRLQQTFEASKTSYRLLMFLNMFRRTINRGTGQFRKTLVQLRDGLFDAHGAPPGGTAARLAGQIKGLQEVDSFPKFLTVMGLTPPPASVFTRVLRDCVEDSVRKGYSVWGISQDRALTLRREADPIVQVRLSPNPEWASRGTFQGGFFPNPGRGKRGGHGGRGGRDRGRGGRG